MPSRHDFRILGNLDRTCRPHGNELAGGHRQHAVFNHPGDTVSSRLPGTHRNIQNVSIHIKDGKIAAVGKDLNTHSSATVVDAGGK